MALSFSSSDKEIEKENSTANNRNLLVDSFVNTGGVGNGEAVNKQPDPISPN